MNRKLDAPLPRPEPIGCFGKEETSCPSRNWNPGSLKYRLRSPCSVNIARVNMQRRSKDAEVSWNVMAHAQKPDFVFLRNGRVHLNRRGHQFSRLLAAEVWASAVVMLDSPCFEVVRRVIATHSIRQLPLHYPSRASPCAITFQLDSTTVQQG